MDMINPSELQKRFHQTAFLGKMMIASLFVFAGVIEIAKIMDYTPLDSYSRLFAANTLGIAFLAMAIIIYFVLRFVRSNFSASTVEKLYMTSIMMLAACESLAIPGLMLFFITGHYTGYYICMGLSLGLFYFYFPRIEQWHEWIKRDKSPKKKAGLFNTIIKVNENKWMYIHNPMVRLICLFAAVLFNQSKNSSGTLSSNSSNS